MAELPSVYDTCHLTVLCLQAPLIFPPYCNKSDLITQAGSIIPLLKTFNNFPLHLEWNLNSSLWPSGFQLIFYHVSPDFSTLQLFISQHYFTPWSPSPISLLCCLLAMTYLSSVTLLSIKFYWNIVTCTYLPIKYGCF